MAARRLPPRSLPARSRIMGARCSSGAGPMARAPCRRSCRWFTAGRSNSPPRAPLPPSGAATRGRPCVPDILEDGPGEAPAELLVARGAAPLTARDADVRLGLDTLQHRGALVQRTAALRV